MKKILVVNGPNLNLTGLREPEIYGRRTLSDINAELRDFALSAGAECTFVQSNCEGEIIDAIHSLISDYDGCVLNAGAYTHYSYAIRDAVASVSKPVIEVHMSNVHAREQFRHTSVISEVCKGVIAGFGENSYRLAIRALCDE